MTQLKRYSSLIISVLVSVLVLGYLVLMVMRSFSAFSLGGVTGIGLGIGVLCLVAAGGWAVYATVKSGVVNQRLSARAAAEGFELDVSDLPRLPSGRIEREAADRLFSEVAQEWQDNPDDWRTNYRLARAYDYAGDRTRGRACMKQADELERRSRATDSGR